MRKHGKFEQRMDIWVTNDLRLRLEAEATKLSLPVAELVRDILNRGLEETAAAEGKEVVASAVRQALKPFENRLAKLISKTAVMAATSAYLNTQALADLGKHDLREMSTATNSRRTLPQAFLVKPAHAIPSLIIFKQKISGAVRSCPTLPT